MIVQKSHLLIGIADKKKHLKKLSKSLSERSYVWANMDKVGFKIVGYLKHLNVGLCLV